MPTVPFKYAQSFKDIFASFTGSPKLLLTSADFEGMWSHMLPLLAAPPHSTPSPSLDTPHQAVVTVFADQGGLPEKEFLTFVAEVFQVVSANNAALTYDALAWVMVEGLVERQFFAETGALAGLEVQASADGTTTVDLKEIRLVLDPHIRAVRLDVGTLYTAECGSSERIDRRRLMNVLRAVFGATTPNFGLLMKWSRATKPVARGRPSVIGAPAAGVTPSSVSSTPTDLRSVLRPVGSTGAAAAAAATSTPSTSSSTSKPAAESASSMFGVTLRTTAGPPSGVGGGDKTPRSGTPVAAEAPSSFALAPTAAAASSSSSAPPPPPPAAASSPQLDESTTLANSMTVATAEEPSSPPAVTENKPAEPTARNSSSITFEIPTVVVAASEPERSPTPPSQQSAAVEQRSASPSLPPPPPPPPPPRPMTPPRVKPEAPPAAAARTAPPQQPQQQQQEPQQQQPLLRDPPPLPDAVRQALQRHQQQQAQLHASTLSAHKQQQQQQQPSSYSFNPSASTIGNRYAAAAAPSSPSRDELLRCAATSTTTTTTPSNVLMGRSAVSLMGLRHAQDLPPEVLSFVTALDQQRTTLQQMLEEELTQLTTGQQTLQMLQQRRASLQHAQQHPLYLTLEGERTELLHRMEQWVQKHNARQHAAQVEVQKVQRDRLMRQVEETQAYHSLLPPTSTTTAVPAPQVAGMPGYTHPSLPRYADPLATTVPTTTTTTVELPSAVAVQALQIVSDPTPRLAAFFEAMSGHEEQIAHRQAALRKLHQLSKKEDKIRAEMADLEQQQQQLSPRQDRYRSVPYEETAAVGGHSDFPQPPKEGIAGAAGRRDTPTDRTVNTILMPQGGSPPRYLQSSSSASSPLQKTVTVQQHEELILKKLEQYLSKKATSIS